MYIVYPNQLHVDALQWHPEQLQKYGLYAYLKKCQFHKDDVRFLDFVVTVQGNNMEEKRIETIKYWPESYLIRDI